jgi:FkbM family methyltransferase
METSWLSKIPYSAEIYIYGAGKYGNKILKELKEKRPGIIFKGFIDTYRKGEDIISWRVFKERKPDCDLVIIGSGMYWEEMKRNLESIGYKYVIPALDRLEVSEEELEAFKTVENMISIGKETYNLIVNARIERNFGSIERFYEKKKNRGERYFEFIFLPEDAVVIEGGVFEGEISKKILNYLGSNGEVHGFDIYGDNFISENLKQDSRLHIYPFALWKKETILYFPVDFENFTPGGTYVLSEKQSNTIEIPAVSIDRFVNSKSLTRVDFIKMDIEGAEIEALEGAKETIKKFKPQMAIAVYHELSHYYKIPLYIKNIYPGYKIFFEHYSPKFDESIMYFLPE